jgi:hypothetical protein
MSDKQRFTAKVATFDEIASKYANDDTVKKESLRVTKAKKHAELEAAKSAAFSEALTAQQNFEKALVGEIGTSIAEAAKSLETARARFEFLNQTYKAVFPNGLGELSLD